MKRTVIKIDESRCTGCGACVKGCHEGVLQVIDGKARVVNETCCDGLGACIGSCPAGALTLEEREAEPYKEQQACCNISSPMRQFPIQLRLVNPNAPFLRNSDLVLAADCTAFVYSHFHHQFMQNNSIVIACPKLDSTIELYIEKLTAMIDDAAINSLTVIMKEVPCCGGLWHIAQRAQANAGRKIPIRKVIVGVDGELREG